MKYFRTLTSIIASPNFLFFCQFKRKIYPYYGLQKESVTLNNTYLVMHIVRNRQGGCFASTGMVNVEEGLLER